MIDKDFNILLDAVIGQARFMNLIKEDSEFLYKNLNNLNHSIFSEIHQENKEDNRPVVQLRAWAAEIMLHGVLLNDKLVEEQKLLISEQFEKDVFRSWKNPFSIFFPFFLKAEGVNSHDFVEKLSKKVLTALNTTNEFKYKVVDFNGSQNFGNDRLWFAIYNSTHKSQRTAQQLFFEINARGVFASHYNRVENIHKSELRFSAQNFDLDELLKFYRESLFELRDDIFDEFAEYILKRRVYKISHGNDPINDSQYLELFERNLIVINEETRALGTTNITQFDEFMNLNIGDYFYLCRGNKKIVLVGVIIGPGEVCEIKELGDKGWFQRKYKTIALASTNEGYRGKESKWWLPNFNSTLREIPSNEFDLADVEVFVPFFGTKIHDLFLDGNARDIGNGNENEEVIHNVFNAGVFKITDNKVNPVLGVDRIAARFGGIIENLEDNKGQMLGVFGPWGRGKTFFVEQLCEYLKIDYDSSESDKLSDFYFVKFHAWKYQDTKAIWAYLYEQLAESYYTHKDKNKWKYPTQFLIFRQLQKYLLIPVWKNLIQKYLLLRLNFKRYGYGDLISVALMATLYFVVQPIIKELVVENIDKIIDMLYWTIYSIGLFTMIRVTYRMYSLGKMGRRIVEKYTERPSFNHLLGVQAEIQNELRFLLKAWVPIGLIRKKWQNGFGKKLLQYLNRSLIKDWSFLRKQRIKFYQSSEINKGKRVLLFVDDIDRCNENQIIKVVDALRVLLEDEEISKRLVILCAIDERILSRAILWKYKDVFQIDKEYKSDNGQNSLLPQKLLKEYLDKLFISGVKLSPLDPNDMESILENYAKHGEYLEPEESHQKTAPSEANLRPKGRSDLEGIEGPDDFEDYIDFDDVEQVKRINYMMSRRELNWIHSSLKETQDVTPRQIRIVMYRYMFAKSLLIEFLGRSRVNSVWSEHVIKEIVNKSFKTNYVFDFMKFNGLSNIDMPTKELTPKIIEMVVPY